MADYKTLRGMPDILPDEVGIFRHIEDNAREVFALFEFNEIRTPLLEDTGVFVRSIGEETDIVEKEMYSFLDRGGKSISLRPEATASIVRSYVEQGLGRDNDAHKFYYIGPMFRAERPQKGRLRQFHQVGAEIIGSYNVSCDVELLASVTAILASIGITSYELFINSLGCGKDRDQYRNILTSFLEKNSEGLCENCIRRTSTNVLRVLDCKKEGCRDILKQAPAVTEYLCEVCRKDYTELKKLLDLLGISFIEKQDLVRGLDYYTGVVFEISHSSLGAQNAIAAGGRYDKLTKQMGGSDVGATGYALGIERLAIILKKKGFETKNPGPLVIYLGEDIRPMAMQIVDKFRKTGIACDIDHSARSLKGGLKKANKENRNKVVIIGEEEAKSGKLLLKDMESGEQESLPLDVVIGRLKA